MGVVIGLTGVAGDVGVEVKGMGVVDGAGLSSSGLLLGRVLGRDVRVDRVDVHHAGDEPKEGTIPVRSVGRPKESWSAHPDLLLRRALGTVGSAHASHQGLREVVGSTPTVSRSFYLASVFFYLG